MHANSTQGKWFSDQEKPRCNLISCDYTNELETDMKEVAIVYEIKDATAIDFYHNNILELVRIIKEDIKDVN